MKRGELKVTLNYKEIAELFEKTEQHCIICQHVMQKIKTRIEEAGVQAVWDGNNRRKMRRRAKEAENAKQIDIR